MIKVCYTDAQKKELIKMLKAGTNLSPGVFLSCKFLKFLVKISCSIWIFQKSYNRIPGWIPSRR